MMGESRVWLGLGKDAEFEVVLLRVSSGEVK